MSQGQVSRLLKQVEEFRKATGFVPNAAEVAAKIEAMDPAKIDLGPRQDRRTVRQRGRKADDSDDE